MLTDPQSITINAIANSLKRITSGDLTSKYQTADGAYQLRVAHNVDSRERSLIRLDKNVVGVDPFVSTINKPYRASTWLVVERPLNGAGITDTEVSQMCAGFLAYCATAGYMDKIIGLES
jgi:hypothetical protein